MDVDLLDLCFLGARAGGIQEIAMSLYHPWGFQQARYIHDGPQQTLLILQTISWVFGLYVLNQNLEFQKKKAHELLKGCEKWFPVKTTTKCGWLYEILLLYIISVIVTT